MDGQLTIELKPCPFCGAKPDDQDVGLFVVECPNCGIVGPAAENRDAAIQAWNRRAYQDYSSGA